MHSPDRPEARGPTLRNVLSNYMGFSVSVLATLLLTPFLIGHLGDKAFGVWVLINTLLAYFQLVEFGIMPAVIRHVSRHRARGDRAGMESVIGSALCLLLPASLASLGLVVPLTRFGPTLFSFDMEQALLARLFLLVGLLAILAFFRRLFFAILEGCQRFDLLNACAACGTLLGAAASVFAVWQGHGLVALLVILMAQIALETAAEALLIRSVLKLRITPFRSTRAQMRQLADYSLFAFLTDLSCNISHRLDTVVIAIFLPVSAVTHYAIATRISGVLEKFVDPLMNTFFPLASHLESSRQPGSLKQLLIRGTRGTTLLIVPGLVLAFFYGDALISWWVGKAHVSSSLPVLHIFLGIVFLSVFEATAGRVQLGSGHIRFNAILSSISALLNLSLSLFLVRRLGTVGVALGTLLPAVGCKLWASVAYSCRITGTRLWEFYAVTLLPATLVGLALLAGMAGTFPLFPNLPAAFAVHALLTVSLTAVLAHREIPALARLEDPADTGCAAMQTRASSWNRRLRSFAGRTKS